VPIACRSPCTLSAVRGRVVPDTGRMTDVDFVGGMNVPYKVGRASASVPLARLEVVAGELVIRPRGVAGRVLPAFVVPLAEVDAVFPLTGRWLRSGVGVATSHGATAYFWTWRGPLVLEALGRLGLPVEASARRPSKMWW